MASVILTEISPARATVDGAVVGGGDAGAVETETLATGTLTAGAGDVEVVLDGPYAQDGAATVPVQAAATRATGTRTARIRACMGTPIRALRSGCGAATATGGQRESVLANARSTASIMLERE